MTEVDVAIVGGGPAGQAAALILGRGGARVAVIDEQARPGGQILRQPPAAFTLPRWMTGASYRGLRQQLAAFEALSEVRWLGNRSVIGIDGAIDAFTITTTTSTGVERIGARRVLIAAGCYDLPVAIPGWTLPGAMGAGGLQALVKAQGVLPGDRIALAGTHPLMLIVAAQIVAAGGAVAEILFEQTRRSMLANLGGAVPAAGPLRDAARALVQLRRAGVAVRFGQRLLAIEGADAVAALRVADRDGRERRLACDAVGLCYGFLPQSDLPRQAGLAMRWASPTGGWAATHDEWMRGSIPGIAVAGETTGVAGAPAALQAGRIAGVGLAADLGLIDLPAACAIQSPAARAWRRARRFAATLDRIADPGPTLARLSETIVCRCEDVTLATLNAAIGAAPEVNAVKLATRCGMGLCQGRGCEHLLTRLVAAHCGVTPDTLRPFTPRFPARPVRIGDLLG